MNNFKKISDIMHFLRTSKVKNGDTPLAALRSMSLKYVDSKGGDYVEDGEDILFELPLLVKFAEMEVNNSLGLDDEEREMCLEALKSVNEFISSCISGISWVGVKNTSLTSNVVMSLKLAASVVKASGIVNEIDKGFAIKCVEDLTQIRNDVINSLIPNPLKQHLISNISELMHIFDTIEAYGVRDAEEKLKILIADVYLNSNAIPTEEQSKLKPLLNKLGEVLTKFRNGVGNARAIEYVAETYDKIL